jgi:hypothetical protein
MSSLIVILKKEELIGSGYIYENIGREFIYEGIVFKLIENGIREPPRIFFSRRPSILPREPKWLLTINNLEMNVTNIK